MASSTYTQQMLEIQEEIEKTNEEITKVWNEFLLLKSGESASKIKLPVPESRPAYAESLTTNFISRAFIHKIYGYPEFNEVLLGSLVSCCLKGNNQKIGQIIGVHEVPDTYKFCFDDIKYYTTKKVAVRLSDRSLHFVSFNEISDELPSPEDFKIYKCLCKTNEVNLPSDKDAAAKEIAIKNASTRIVTDIESYQIDIIRTKPYTSIQTSAKEKVIYRGLKESAVKRGQKKIETACNKKLEILDKKSEFIASFRKADLQDNLQKSIDKRQLDERLKDAKNSFPREPKLMDGFTRVPTFATASQKNEMSALAQKKFDEQKRIEEENKLEARRLAKGPDLFKIHNFTTGTETKFNPGNDSQQLRDLTSKLKSKKRTPRRQTIVNAVSAQREVKPNSSNKSLTADGEKKKITLTDYKSRRSKTN